LQDKNPEDGWARVLRTWVGECHRYSGLISRIRYSKIFSVSAASNTFQVIQNGGVAVLPNQV